MTKIEYVERAVRDFGCSRATAVRWYRAIQAIGRANPQERVNMQLVVKTGSQSRG